MKKYKKYFISTVLIIIILILMFIPFEKKVKIEKSECVDEYSVDLNPVPNQICQKSTGGHCGSNDMRILNARNRVANCLCIKYNQEKSDELRNTILDFCKEEKICEYRLVNYNKDEDVNVICKNPNDFFIRMFIK